MYLVLLWQASVRRETSEHSSNTSDQWLTLISLLKDGSALGFSWQPSTTHLASLSSRLTASAYGWLWSEYCQGTPRKYTITRPSLSIYLWECVCVCLNVFLWSQSSDWSLIFYFFRLGGAPQEKNTLLFTHTCLTRASTHAQTQEHTWLEPCKATWRHEL